MRRKTSLLLANGHPEASSYPLGFLGDEVTLLTERQNAMFVTLGVVVQGAGASIMSKKGGEHFTKLLKQMTET